MKKFLTILVLPFLMLLSGCDDDEWLALKVDPNLGRKTAYFLPDNCWLFEQKYSTDMFCRVLMTREDGSQERLKISFDYDQRIGFNNIRATAFNTYIIDVVKNTSDQINSCQRRNGSNLLFCNNDQKIDIDKLYWSTFNPIYVEETYGCVVKNEFLNKQTNVLCGDKYISKLELAVGSFFDASKGLMLKDIEKATLADILMKKEFSEDDYKKVGEIFKIEVIK